MGPRPPGPLTCRRGSRQGACPSSSLLLRARPQRRLPPSPGPAAHPVAPGEGRHRPSWPLERGRGPRRHGRERARPRCRAEGGRPGPAQCAAVRQFTTRPRGPGEQASRKAPPGGSHAAARVALRTHPASFPCSSLKRRATESPGLAASRPERCPLSSASTPNARGPRALGLPPCGQSPLHPCSEPSRGGRRRWCPEPRAGTQWGPAVARAFHATAVVRGP